MQEELDKLAHNIGRFIEPPEIDDRTWQKFADKTIVALMAGGLGSRFNEVLNGKSVNKNVLELPNGDTMIEMAIRMYRDAGIKKFTALVFHNAHSIEDRLGDGSDLGVEITYSHDPNQPVGKGGAVRNALDNGSIPNDHNLIVHNPDDVILEYKGSFPRYIGRSFIEGKTLGKQVTVVCVPEWAAPSTGMMVVDNEITDIEMYPNIPIPAHIGVTVISPKLFPRFKKLFDLSQKTDFEAVLFPLLAKEQKLWASAIPNDNWLAVNDLKSYKQLLERLGLD